MACKASASHQKCTVKVKKTQRNERYGLFNFIFSLKAASLEQAKSSTQICGIHCAAQGKDL